MKFTKRFSILLLALALTVSAFLVPSINVQAKELQQGNFMWIWQIQNEVDHYGSIDNLIAHLKSLGVNNVCIKFHEGSSSIGGGVDFRSDFYKYKDAFKTAGFEVGTWGYNYFNYLPQEEGLIEEAAQNSDYYIFDPEIDVANKFAQTAEVLQAVRSAVPNAELGYSSFPVATYHEDIDYSDFNKYCDFASPQIYWGEMEWNPQTAIDRTLSDYKSLGLDKPIYPSIQTYGVTSDSYNLYKSYGFKSTGLWSFDEMNDTAAQFVSGNFAATNTVNNNVAAVNTDNATATLQSNLNKIINTGLAVDGSYGPLTTAAVIKFQGIMGLTQDGIAGPNTNGAIQQILSKPVDSVPSKHYEYATRFIQWRVGAGVDGDYWYGTAYKVKQWQIRHGLEPDTVTGPQTWKSFGL